MDRHEIQLFWQRRTEGGSRDKNKINILKKRVKELNKKVQLLNQQIAQMHKGNDKPVAVALSLLYGTERLLT